MAKKQLQAKGRSKGKGNRLDRLLVAGIIVALAAITLTLWGPLHKHRSGDEKRPQAKKTEPAPAKHPATEKREEKKTGKRDEVPALTSPEKVAFIAIIIDDLGQDLKPAREVLSLPARITCAVMPGLAQSRKVADLAKQSNREILLHLPMEPKNRNMKASPGTLRSDMTPMDFLTTITDDVASVPGAVGVNNHEGSSLTENKEAMKFLMAELKTRDLLFLDSLTSPKSVAYATAKEFGLKAAKRDVFLDNESENTEYIGKQLEELASIARTRGRAIGIGHPHPATISALRKWLTTVQQQGIEIVPVSRLMK